MILVAGWIAFSGFVATGCSSSTDAQAGPNGPLVSLHVAPDSVSTPAKSAITFAVQAVWSDSSTAPPLVSWSVVGLGSITQTGTFTAGNLPGRTLVIARYAGLADTAVVIVSDANNPPPGQYEPLVTRDWRNYADKAALQGMFFVEGGLNACTSPDPQYGTRCAPHLPVTAFYDLVDDPLFGKVVRYLGDTTLNTFARNMPGRTAMRDEPLGGKQSIWVHQYVRFSSNWTPESDRGGQGSGGYKLMFLRHQSTRVEHTFDNTYDFESGPGTGGAMSVRTLYDSPTYGLTPGQRAWNGARWLPKGLYKFTYWSAGPGNGGVSVNWLGNQEWYEFVLGQRQDGADVIYAWAIRQYTQGGVVNPLPWMATVKRVSNFVAKPVLKYEMGVNRNRQYDESMHIDWGPYEIVDGEKYPNPWGIPGVP